ncbi:MAG: hypothetical protein V1909_00405 [Candidatus Micrarchaeota archaeon]
MRFDMALAALLFSAMLCFSETDVNSSIKEVLEKELNFTENYSVSYFGVNGDSYGFITYTYITYNVTSNGTDANITSIAINNTAEVFIVNASAGKVLIVTENATVDLLLRARNMWLLTDLVQEIRGDVIAFNQSRELEAKCKTSLGLDRALCWDADTCLYRSCIYSQAICLPFAQGNGKPFLDAMAGFSKATVALDLDTGEFIKALNAFTDKKTAEAPKETPLADMEAQVAAIGNNNLFKAYSGNNNGFEFCLPIPYRKDALVSAKTKLAQLQAKLATDSMINASRNRILSETHRRILALELARNKTQAFLGEIKANASREFALTSAFVAESSKTVFGQNIDDRMMYLNKTLGWILNSSNASAALFEYLAFQNETSATKTSIEGYKKDFNDLLTLSNECTAIFEKADANITSVSGKAELEGLKAKKEGLDVKRGPPIDEKNLVSIKVGLIDIKRQAEALILEEGPVSESRGPDYVVAGAALIAIVLAGTVYWLVQSGKVRLPFMRKGGAKVLGVEKPAETAEKDSAERALAPAHTQAPVANYRVRLAMQGGAYRTKIRTVVRDSRGNPVPDGTPVAFKADTGVITPSALTHGGTVFASMAFKDKPSGVTISVSALGIERIVKLSFI